MPITAKLHNGSALEFPDGTPDDVIDKAVMEALATPEPSLVKGEPPPPSFTDSLIQQAPQTVGGIALGVGAVAAGAGAIPAVAAVGLGGGFGESMRQIGQHIAGSPDAPKSSTEAALRIGKAGGTEAAFDTFGRLVMGGVGKVLAPFKSRMAEGAAEAIKMFKGKITPVVFTPAEATQSRVLDIMQNVIDVSIVGGNSMSDFKVARTKFFDEFADSLIDQFGSRTSPEELGNLFVASIEKKKEVHGKVAQVLYNNVEEMIGTKIEKVAVTESVETGMVDANGRPLMREVTKMVDKEVPAVLIPTGVLKEFSKHPRKLADNLGGIEAKNAGDDLMSAIMDLPDNIDFNTAKELRSRLISRVDEFSVINKKAPAIGKARRLISLLDEQIGTSLKQLDVVGADSAGGSVSSPTGQSPYEAWRTANKFYKEGQENFNNVFIRRMVKLADETGTGAENIAPKIFKPGQISQVRKVKNAVDNETWGKLQGFFVGHLMDQSTDTEGKIVGDRLLNKLSGKPGSYGMDMLNETLSQPQVRELVNFGKALKLTQAGQSEGTGKVLVQLSQAGALMMLARGQLKVPAATILIGPAVLSKMMLNPVTCRMLTAGVQLPAHSPQAAGVLARIVAASARIKGDTDGSETGRKP